MSTKAPVNREIVRAVQRGNHRISEILAITSASVGYQEIQYAAGAGLIIMSGPTRDVTVELTPKGAGLLS